MAWGKRGSSFDPTVLTRYVYPRKKTPFQKGTLKIGQVAKKAGIPVVTVRFYEKEKLLKSLKSPDKKTNHRRFADTAVGEIEFIKTCRAAGFSIPQIRSMMKLFRGFRPPAKLLMGSIYRTLDSIRHQIMSLEEVQRILIVRMSDPSGDIAKLIEEDPEIWRLRGLKRSTKAKP